MTSSLGDYPPHHLRNRFLSGVAKVLVGLVITWAVISGAYYVDAVRDHYEGMTTFVPVGLVVTLALSPIWIWLHALLLRYYRGSLRSLIAVTAPTIIIIVLGLLAIWLLNAAWMAGPDY